MKNSIVTHTDSEHVEDDGPSDREILLEILASQRRVEEAVGEFLEMVKPTVETLSKGGIMGLLGSFR